MKIAVQKPQPSEKTEDGETTEFEPFHLTANLPIQLTGLSVEDAKNQIRRAGRGWGTDESAIYNAIRNCDDRRALQSDPEVQRILNDELSGHDLWKAQLLLEFGRESNFPAPIQEIWSATRGWGTDESRIYEALQRLSPAEVARISRVPGLRAILRSELSGNDLTAANDLLSGTYAEAIARHTRNMQRVIRIMDDMRRNGNEREKNSAEWIQRRRTRFFVGTRTHDSQRRARHITGKNDQFAYFGSKDNQEAFPNTTATYSAHIDNNSNIITAGQYTGGLNWGTHFNVLDPEARSETDASIREVIVHETQHTADRHHDEAGYAGGGANQAWARYKTEFRAYWVDGQRNHLNDRSGTGTNGFDNARQQAIYRHLYQSYEYVTENWDNNPTVTRSAISSENGQTFQNLVKSYSRPEGINLENSIRIDDFYQALSRCTPRMDNSAPEVVRLFQAIDRLGLFEGDSIIHDPAKRRLRDMMNSNLSPDIKSRVERRLILWDYVEPASGNDTAIA